MLLLEPKLIKLEEFYPFVLEQLINLLNKKSLEGGIFNIKSQLEYKSSLYGKHFKKIDPAYTTQDCSSCGYRNTELDLNDRKWTCPECGEHHDRDQNASKNILKASGF